MHINNYLYFKLTRLVYIKDNNICIDVRTLEEIEYSKYLYAFVDVNRYYFAVFNDKNTIILAIKPTDDIIKEFSKYEL